ncbi:MAG TPA: hypothetical protein VGE15_07870 [Sphingobacteriaceae bacterium]
MKNSVASYGNSSISYVFYRCIFTVLALFGSLQSWAQDVPDKVEVDIDAGQTAWYGQPWVWAVGVALFIIIIVAITRSGSRREA